MEKNLKKIMTIGGATQDIFLQQDVKAQLQLHKDHEDRTFLLLEEGTKIEIARLHYAVGGGAANSAVSFKRQGFRVISFFKIGRDCQGEFILDKLEKESGIDTSHHKISATKHTGSSYILPSASGNRTILAYRGANADLQENDIPLSTIEEQKYLYITSLSQNSAQLLPTIVARAKQAGCMVTINPGSSQLKADIESLIKALPQIDIFILNAEEARTLFAGLIHHKKIASTPFTIENYLEAVLKLGPKTAIVTNGREGVYVHTDNFFYFCPSVTLPVQNTVGAGDAFGSTFFASIINGYPIEKGIIRGIINSASVIQHQDAQAGLLSQDELDKAMKNYNLQKLRKYSR
jgi:sugar/nucleoside kinase (ribokinase family)